MYLFVPYFIRRFFCCSSAIRIVIILNTPHKWQHGKVANLPHGSPASVAPFHEEQTNKQTKKAAANRQTEKHVVNSTLRLDSIPMVFQDSGSLAMFTIIAAVRPQTQG